VKASFCASLRCPGLGAPMTPCRHYQRGYCRLGDKCGFSHTEGGPPTRTKSSLCRHYERGLCLRGDTCFFAHGDSELGQVVYLNPEQCVPPAARPIDISWMAKWSTPSGSSIIPEEYLATMPATTVQEDPLMNLTQGMSAGSMDMACLGMGMGMSVPMLPGLPSLGSAADLSQALRQMSEVQPEDPLEAHMKALEKAHQELMAEEQMQELIQRQQALQQEGMSPFNLISASDALQLAAMQAQTQAPRPQSSAEGPTQVQQFNWKTETCWHFKKGFCANGSACSWAHGDEELMVPGQMLTGGAPSQDARIRPEAEAGDEPERQRRRLDAGGAGTSLPRKTRWDQADDEVADAALPRTSPKTKWDQVPQRFSTPFLQFDGKTVLCKDFADGHCAAGAYCSFAHGELELRQRGAAGDNLRAQAV